MKRLCIFPTDILHHQDNCAGSYNLQKTGNMLTVKFMSEISFEVFEAVH